MPAISVIVPVYQAEKQLRACIDSMLGQSFSDWELLLIDDGSRDASPAICEEYAKKDDRIRVFHKTNGGVSSARNIGLQEAKGEAIAFLDADDAYEPKTLETLWMLRSLPGVDTGGCAHWNVTPAGVAAKELLLPEGIYDQQALRERIVAPLIGDRLSANLFNGYIVRYLFDAELLRKENILFEGAYLEDELFLVEYFTKAQGLAVTEDPLYRYIQNPESATRKYMKDYQQVFSRFMERKEEAVARLGLGDMNPQWRENTLWAGLLIAIGNEYAKGSPKTIRQRQQAVKDWCTLPEMAHAIKTLQPKGMGRNKQIVADLVCGGHFTLLTLLYRLKNRI